MHDENTTTEEWRPVPGFNGRYEVSNHGRVRSWAIQGCCYGKRDKPSILSLTTRVFPGGLKYKFVNFWLNGKMYNEGVHGVVLSSFVGPRPKGHHAAHWNGDGCDNRPENLRWATPLENNGHDKERHGTIVRGEASPNAKLTSVAVLEIREMAKEGHTYASIAVDYGVSKSAIKKVVRKTTWKHVE